MSIGSQTSRTFPASCPLCGYSISVDETSSGAVQEDAPCPECGLPVQFSDLVLQVVRRRAAGFWRGHNQPIGPDQPVIEIVGDSLNDVEMLMELEEKFDIRIPESDSETLVTVRDLIRYLERRCQARRRS